MLRKELRRHERRETLRRRLLAGSTAVVLALGMAAGGAAPAFAASPSGGSTTNTNSEAYWQQLPGEVCVKPSFSTENSTLTPFSLPALGAGLAYSKVIVKAGSTGKSVQQENVVYTTDSSGGSLTQGDTFVHPEKNSISHVIYCYVPSVPSASTDVDCTTIEFLVGRALNGSDHINVDIVYNGQRGQINVEINEVKLANGDPVSDSGLYALYKFDAIGLPNVKVAISEVDAAEGRIVFGYSAYLTGQWTIEWVQFNSTYFNKDRVTADFVVCGDLPTENLVTPTARMVDLECDTDGSYTLDDIEGVRWFIGDDEVQPGTYTVTTAQTIVVRAEADAPEFGLEPGATDEFTFEFTEPDDCVLPCLPASAVSYTYYNLSNDSIANPANSGLITVTAREGYSAELCDPFWVVAASWNYSSSTSIWPQTLRSTDPAGDDAEGYIESVGTYFFHAPVECGQGDVYASFTGMPYVGPELFGPSNPFTERFLHGMGFTGPRPTYLNTQPGCNLVNPIAPTANPIVECETYGSIDVSDVANPYVGYTVYRGEADENGSVAGLDTVPLSEASEGVFTVVATPLNGHIFAPGTERQWEFDLGAYYDCELPELPITNASIGFIDPTCEQGQRLDPAKLLVEDDTLAELERYEEFDDGTYEVVFVTTDDDARFFDSDTPTEGRTVSENGTVLTFSGTLSGPLAVEECLLSIIVIDPYGVDDTCFADPTYWVELVEGIMYRITVDDEAPVVVEWEGTDERRTFSAAPGSSLRIVAAPASELFTLAPQPGPLSHVFAEDHDDCLPTLPLTEGSVTFTPASCLDATNWVVLPSTEGVQWWVDGEPTAAGSWAMPAGEVVVEATPLQGFGFPLEAETRWEYEFAADDDSCDLSSLAETGASNALVGVGLVAVLMTLAGFGVVIGRRFQQA